MRLVLCENGLQNRDGHHYNLSLALREELARRRVPLLILAREDTPGSISSELSSLGVFKRAPYEVLSERRWRRVRVLLEVVHDFWRGLRRGGVGSDDLVLIETALLGEVLGAALWCWTRGTKPAAIVLNLLFDDIRTQSSPRVTAFLYRLGVKLARLRLGSRLVLTAGTTKLAAERSRSLGHPVRWLPLPSIAPEPDDSSEQRPRTIAFLGSPRPEKGWALLGELVQECAAAERQAHVLVQLPEALAELDGWRPNVRCVPCALQRDRYHQILRETDIVVLPYDARTFGRRTSGVFTEAAALGAVTVVPTGTWMSDMLETGRGAGVTFREFSVAAIVRAVRSALENFAALHEQALTARTAWRDTHEPSAYVDELLGFAPWSS